MQCFYREYFLKISYIIIGAVIADTIFWSTLDDDIYLHAYKEFQSYI